MMQSSGTKAIIVTAGLVIVTAGLKIGAPILVPLALAIFLAMITTPVVSWLRRQGVPTVVAVPLVILMTFGAFAGLITVATQSLSQMRLAFPRYVAQFHAIEESFLATLRQWGLEVPSVLHVDWGGSAKLVDLASSALVGLAGIMSTVFLVLLITVFILFEANGFADKIRAAFAAPDLDLSRYTKIVSEVQRYLAFKTVISLVTGLLVGLWVWFLGVDFPIFWGLIAFLFNYVPNVGSVVAAIPPIGLALVQLGMKGAILTTIGYLAVNMVLGNMVEPALMGRKLGLSTLVVMISLVFWGWVWGPTGMLLALPMTMIVKIMLENSQDYRWIAVLLGPSPRNGPEIASQVEAEPEPATTGNAGATVA